jgi:hypothetical protein
MTTKTTDLQWEIQAYGMTKAELNRMVKTQAFPGQELMFAAGMLSDAQQVLDPEFNADGWVSPETLLIKHVNISTVPRPSCLMSWTHHVVVQ